ncbi:nucleoside diphosphate kinase 6-like isoform 2-T2 [Liasis olivaceus]
MRPSRPGLRRALQLTLAIAKPDAVAHPLVLQAVHETILSHKFLIVRTKDLLWSREDSQRFYQEHSGRFFYQRLVEFMSSGPMRVYILAHEEAIARWRSLMGPTKVYRARHTAPESIRGTLGLTDTRNTVHGSDFSEEEWYQREEPQLRGETVCPGPRVVIHRGPGDSWTEQD